MKVTPNYCLFCKRLLDAVETRGETTTPEPEVDDITVCLYCGHIMAFDNKLRFRELTDEEMTDIAGEEDILAIQRLRAEFIKMRLQ